MSLEFGRRPARYTPGSVQRAFLFNKVLADLGTPPASSDDYVSAVDTATGGDWGMDGNDTEGDCTIADSSHQVMLRTANCSKIVIPTTAQCLAIYNSLTGGQDTGLDELTVIQYLGKTGFLGHKVDAAANVDPANLNHIKWTIQLYGACRLGINFVDSMMDQFNKGLPWDVVPGAKLTGDGHDVPLVRYITVGQTTQYFVVTWAKMIPVTEAFLLWQIDGTPVVEEAHAECSTDFIKATGASPAGYDHDALMGYLGAIAN